MYGRHILQLANINNNTKQYCIIIKLIIVTYKVTKIERIVDVIKSISENSLVKLVEIITTIPILTIIAKNIT